MAKTYELDLSPHSRVQEPTCVDCLSIVLDSKQFEDDQFDYNYIYTLGKIPPNCTVLGMVCKVDEFNTTGGGILLMTIGGEEVFKNKDLAKGQLKTDFKHAFVDEAPIELQFTTDFKSFRMSIDILINRRDTKTGTYYD